VTNDKANNRRRRGVWQGLLVVLLLALGSAGYALASSPSAPTGKPSASPSSRVLAPAGSTPAAKQTTSTTTSTSAPVVLAPAATASNGNGGNDNCVEPSNGNGNCVKTFGVTVGQVPTLYPSVVRSVPLTYANPNSFDILVTTYRVSVAVPSSTSTVCPASSLQVPAGTISLGSGLVAPRKGSVSSTFPVSLGANAPSGCQGVMFTITVNATAVKK
jgi:hypothetical protein